MPSARHETATVLNAGKLAARRLIARSPAGRTLEAIYKRLVNGRKRYRRSYNKRAPEGDSAEALRCGRASAQICTGGVDDATA